MLLATSVPGLMPGNALKVHARCIHVLRAYSYLLVQLSCIMLLSKRLRDDVHHPVSCTLLLLLHYGSPKQT
jgi:hypothetical protein